LAALQLPFTILLIRNFDAGIPSELMEAAKIDGATTTQAFLHVILPLTKPIGSAVAMLTLINSWNSYLLPLLFLQKPSMQTVTLLPQYFQGEFTNDQTKILAAAVLTAIPEIVAYLCMQKNFERGMSAGALK
jgi:raffinose/stachyose/melibiose transport system permease protein